MNIFVNTPNEAASNNSFIVHWNLSAATGQRHDIETRKSPLLLFWDTHVKSLVRMTNNTNSYNSDPQKSGYKCKTVRLESLTLLSSLAKSDLILLSSE